MAGSAKADDELLGRSCRKAKSGTHAQSSAITDAGTTHVALWAWAPPLFSSGIDR
jgi:hypothetical protein